MSLLIRPFKDDYSTLARLYSEHYSRSSTEENIKEFENSFPAHLFREIWIAEFNSGAVAAAILTHNKVFYHPDQYEFNILVRKDQQGKGFANTIFHSITDRVSRRNPKILKCTIPEHFENGIRFLKKRNFSEYARLFPSEFVLADFQKEKYSELENRLLDKGITFKKLYALCDPQYRDKIYDLFVQIDRSIPGSDLRPLRTLKEFWSNIDNGSQNKDSFFVAMEGDKYVGLHIGGPMAGNDEFLVKLTGILPDYKNLGIATVLKAKGMTFAKENGFHIATTWNDSRNLPILALNEKFGFQRKSVAISFIKHFDTNSN